MLITRLLILFTLFYTSTQDGNDQENGVLHCGPQNLSLTRSDKKILLTWEDEPSCSAIHDELIYELQVLIADKQVHDSEVAVAPSQIGSTHSWTWMSDVALECTSHSVRLRYRYQSHTSPWKHGEENLNHPQVFPRDRVFQVGSRVTFCCVVPARQSFVKMYTNQYDDADMNTTKISHQLYALTIQLSKPSRDVGMDVICETNTSVNGASVYIGYPPDDRDLECETRDLESVECHWTVGGNTLPIKNPTVYQLLGRPCTNGSTERCSQKVLLDVGERNWTLTAKNKIGKVELSDRADLTKRVHMFAPTTVMASNVNTRNVSLEWGWTVPQYNNLKITCQVNIGHGDKNTISEHVGFGLHFVIVNNLIPYWKYDVTVRCGTAQHFWKWSDWSRSISFQTKGDVPDALDVWMQVKSNHTIITWKIPLANQSHGDIENYNVTWAKATETEKQNAVTVHNKLSNSQFLYMNTTEEYMVTVTARNINGSSSPSTITIPRLNPDRAVKSSRITGNDRGFNLSWSASPTANCGYIVDWCPAVGHCSVEWLKVPPNETNAHIFSKNFIGGVRYSISVYACTQGAPVLLERREGYISEKKIEDGLFKSLTWKQQNSDVEVSWEPVHLSEQPAFIEGYVLYLANSNTSIRVHTENPEATSLTARNLKISSYKFTVKAHTAAGESGDTTINATLNSQTDNAIMMVSIALLSVFGLLSLIIILCYRHWACIKHKVYPPIPKPVLTDKWLTSLGENTCHRLSGNQCHNNEASIIAVPVMCNSGRLGNGYISQENMPFIFSQTPKGYYNQALKKSASLDLMLSPPAIPSQSSSQAQFRGVFPNPSYNLIMQTGHQQLNLQSEFQEGTSLEPSPDGYQPQSSTFTTNQMEEVPDSPMSCVSTYMLLPSSPSK